MSLDDCLKEALERKEPPEGFEARLMARLGEVAAENAHEDGAPVTGVAEAGSRRSVAGLRRLGLLVSAAAAILLTLGGLDWLETIRERDEGEQAKAQLMLALHIASEKANFARQQVYRAGATAR